jgi:MSHA pilin protein MshA
MNKSIKNTAQAGFTLIELIVVIVILGILAATALPKFADMSGDARAAAVQGVRGSLASAAALAHAQAVVKSQTGATGSVTMEGTSIALAYGYPTIASIETAANVSGVNRVVNADAAAGGYQGPTPVGMTDIAFLPSGITVTDVKGKNCYAKYSEATATSAATTMSDTASCP